MAQGLGQASEKEKTTLHFEFAKMLNSKQNLIQVHFGFSQRSYS